jgi:hypothetical protein
MIAGTQLASLALVYPGRFMHHAAVALALAGLLSAPAWAEYAESMAVVPGGALEIDIDLGAGLRPDPGELRVSTHDRDEVRIEAEASGWGAWSIRLDLSGDAERSRFVASVGGSFSWMFGGPRLRVRVWVPREFSVDARCSSGPIRIEEVHGEIRARTSDADIELVSGEGSARLRTSDGGIQVTELLGDAEVRTSSGPVEISWVSGDVDVRTGEGAIELTHIDGSVSVTTDEGPITLEDVSGHVEARTERGPVYASFRGAPSGFLETRRGSVEVFLPGDTGAELEARSLRGEVDIAPGLAWEGERGEKHVLGRINGGGAALRLYTGRGLVRVGEH